MFYFYIWAASLRSGDKGLSVESFLCLRMKGLRDFQIVIERQKNCGPAEIGVVKGKSNEDPPIYTSGNAGPACSQQSSGKALTKFAAKIHLQIVGLVLPCVESL